jgi:hypothetical protein
MKMFERILLAIFVIVIAVLFGLLAIFRNISSDAVAAFIGVLVGGAITSFVQYRISEADRQHQLRTAALEKRLQTHQEAYTLWRKLLFANRDDGELSNVVTECEKWWDKNCLYLTSSAREAFRKAYFAAHDHALFVKIHADIELVKSTWKDLERAGNIIVEGVYLPPISDLESKRIEDSGKDDA